MMDVPEVNENLLGQLEAMGFPLSRAIKALRLSGNNNLESIINWIVDHEHEVDTDNEPVVLKEIEIESPQPSDMTHQIRMKAQEIRNRLRKKKEEEEKRSQRVKEKERIRAGKEFQQAKRVAEENERKQNLATREAEKVEEKRSRKKILQKLESDKTERRSKYGILPRSSATAEQNYMPVAQGTKKTFSSKSTSKAEQMRNCLIILKRKYKDDESKVRRAFQTLLIYVGNIARNPDAEKYRKIRINNPVFQDRVGSLKGGIEFLEFCGFEKVEDGKFLYLPRDKLDMTILKVAGSMLQSAVTNPFFGVFNKE